MKEQIKEFPESLKKILRQYAESLIIAFVLAILVRSFVVTAYRVPTTAMAPTLLSGDFIFASKLPMLFANLFEKKNVISRGDVIVFKCPDNKSFYCIKRVVGMPGETIALENQQVTIDNRPVSYTDANTKDVDLVGSQFLTAKYEKLGKKTLKILLSSEGADPYGPYKIDEDSFFVLGDNRAVSDDSRSYGVIPRKDIVGKAAVIWLSIDWDNPQLGGLLPSFKWQRVFQKVK